MNQEVRRYLVSYCTRAAVTKYHRLGSSDNRYLFSHHSGSQKFEVKVSASLTFSEASLLCFQMLSPPSVFMWSSFWVLMSSSYKDTSHLGLGPNLMIYFNLPLQRHYLQVQSYSVALKVRTSTVEFWRDTTQLITFDNYKPLWLIIINYDGVIIFYCIPVPTLMSVKAQDFVLVAKVQQGESNYQNIVYMHHGDWHPWHPQLSWFEATRVLQMVQVFLIFY